MIVMFVSRIWDNLRLSYRDLKIKHKFFVVHCLIVFIVCSVSLVALQAALHIYDGLLYDESAKVLNLSTINIENELKRIEKLSYTLVSNRDIQNYLVNLKSRLSSTKMAEIDWDLTDILWEYVFERNVASVNLIDSQGTQYSGGPPIDEAMVRKLVPLAAGKEGVFSFVPDPTGAFLIGCRQIRRIHNLSLEPLGTLVIRIKIAELVSQSTTGENNKEVILLILDGKKEIYHSNRLPELLGKNFVFAKNTAYSLQKVNGRRFFESHTRSDFTGWTYFNILPYETVFKQIILMRTIILLIFGILFLCTIFISLRLARNLTRPIESLTQKMKKVEKGDFALESFSPEEAARADEIGDLQRDFAIMIRRIDALIKEDYTKQIVIKEAQFRALQAQINPHFLYNTLESINWLAKVNQQKEISRMVESLGHLFRSAISSKEAVISLGEELQLLDDYITIQKIRFGERLDYQPQINPGWRELRIPKLTLQPLVENAIHYGLEKMLGVCRIAVQTLEHEDCLEILIADDGPGIDEDILEKLKTGVVKPQGLGIGLNNIDDRIKTIFGERFGLTVVSRLEQGTTVSVRIPKAEGATDV